MEVEEILMVIMFLILPLIAVTIGVISYTHHKKTQVMVEELKITNATAAGIVVSHRKPEPKIEKAVKYAEEVQDTYEFAVALYSKDPVGTAIAAAEHAPVKNKYWKIITEGAEFAVKVAIGRKKRKIIKEEITDVVTSYSLFFVSFTSYLFFTILYRNPLRRAPHQTLGHSPR